ncbi:MAG: amino acid adenylation domain-containing protein [Microcoleaceae cyanobacterium]
MSTLTRSETSKIQQANWFLYQFDPNGISDKISIVIRINSSINLPIISETLQTLIERHSVLRSCYSEQDQKLIQSVQETAKVNLESVSGESWSQAELDQYFIEWTKRPFNLEIGSVFRTCLINVSATEYFIGFCIHQIAGDWDSLMILVNEFIALYQSKITSNPFNLPSIKRTYTDYIQQEYDLINSLEGDKIKQYWQQQLGDDLPVLQWPAMTHRPQIRTYNGAVVQFTVSSELTQALTQLANLQNVTLKDLFLAAFKVLIYRYTGETDILVGVWQNRENQSLFKGVIGNFANITVTRDFITEDTKFVNILNQISQTVQQVSDYKNYPFSQLVQQLQLNHLNYPPICQAAFSYQKKQELFENNQLQIELYDIPQQKVDFELDLSVTEIDEEVKVEFKYNSDILQAKTVENMAQHFQNLLIAIAENPQLPIGQLPLLNQVDKQQILREWNQTQTDYDLSKCLHQLVEKQVEKTPDSIALNFEGKTLTYRQLNQRANQLAHYLIKLGVTPDTLVGICVERSLEMVIGLLGILKAGGAYVPIDPNYPQDRISYLLDNSQVTILLTQNQLLPTLPEYNELTVCLDSDWDKITTESDKNPRVELTSNHLIYVIYTSGSTGKPKGTLNTHKGVVNRILWMQDEYQLTQNDKVLQKTPFSFDVSGWEFWWPLMTGAQLIIAKPEGHKDPNYLAELINQQQITTLHFVPSMLQIFLEYAEVKSCQSLRQVFCSGEALSVALQNRFFEYFEAELHNLYGPTEAAIDVTFWRCQPGVEQFTVPIGRPVANTQTYILNSDLQPVPIGVAGELYIGGVQLARGYLNRPELTAERFIQNPFIPPQSPIPPLSPIPPQSPLSKGGKESKGGKGSKGGNQPHSRLYKTGDLARYRPDGNIEYLGRLDHQVKIRGNRIELGEIESVLREYPGVQDSLVLAKEYQSDDKRLVAYLVTQETQLSLDHIRSLIKNKLPDYMMPSAFVLLSEFPLTPNGKVNRKALPEPDFSTIQVSDNFVAPRNSIEQQLAEIFCSLLQMNSVSIKESFFELGGHSLLAIRLMGKIQQQFNQQLPLSTLFTNRTIEELANVIQQDNPVNSSSLVPIQTQGNQPAFFCVHPAGGHVFCYQELSHLLGNNQPFYGLQAQGFNPGETVFTTVEEMAEFYVNAIQQFQPQGPYQIGGWSFGGVVAFEIAQQLSEKGQEVSLLALLDPWVPILLDTNKKIDNLYLTGALSRYFGGIFGTDNLVNDKELKEIPPENKIEFIIDKAEKLGLFPPEDSREKNRRFVDVLVGTLKATYAYKRCYYPGKVTVFRPLERHFHASDPQLVWVELFAVLDAAEIELVNISGGHYSMMKSPHLERLAQALNNCL